MVQGNGSGGFSLFEYYPCLELMWPLEAGEVAFHVSTENSPYDTLQVEIYAPGYAFVYNACDTDSMLTYCVTGNICIDEVVRGESFLVIVDWLNDHTNPWDFSVNCYPYYSGGETCEDPIELLGNMQGAHICTAGRQDDYAFIQSCGLSVPGADVIYKLCLGPFGHFEATLQTDCINWSAMYLFTDCDDPSSSCVAAVGDIGPDLPDLLEMLFDNGPNPLELYLAIDNICDTSHSDGFGGSMMLSVSFDPCPPEKVCCFPDGSCELMFDPDNCYQAGGEWYPEWNTCDPNPCVGSDIGDLDPALLRTALLPARPNPFAQTTLLRYSMEQAGSVCIELFDAAGRVVRHLFTGEAVTGRNSIEWDGCDDDGNRIIPGTYFCRMSTGEQVLTQRVVLLP